MISLIYIVHPTECNTETERGTFSAEEGWHQLELYATSK